MIETFLRTKRAQMPSDFDYTSPVIPEHVINSTRIDFISWYTARYRLTMDDSNFNLPSYIATKSLVLLAEIIPTLCAFTPIIPHPATQFDTIFTCMKNFQDVLLQKNIPYGPLWSNEGVYRIAKEIQLLQPQEFGNIFLCLGFDMEKVVLACLGSLLKESGAKMYLLKQKYLDQLSLTVFWMEDITYVQSKVNVLLYEVL